MYISDDADAKMNPINLKDNKIIIYHRLSYINSNRAELQLPKELFKYVIPAMEEWQEEQAKYKKWYLNKKLVLGKQKFTEEELYIQMKMLQPPEIQLSMPRDQSEGSFSEDW